MNPLEQDHILSLLEKFRQSKATPTDCQEALNFLAAHPSEDAIQIINDFFQGSPAFSIGTAPFHYAEWQSTLEQILAVDKLPESNLQSVTLPVHRIHFLRTAWFRYAAAVLIIFCLGTYLYVSNQKERPSVTQTNPAPVQDDVAPGGQRATLTLSDGSVIKLDSAANGLLTQQGDVKVLKLSNGLLTYKASGVGKGEMLFNTMATPRGGQHRLILPDGSKVWLNAASSITYPTAFTGKEREVKIEGEVYFEVTADKSKSFHVKANDIDVKVLGTHFNINSYSNEPDVKTSLLEGSIKITKGGTTQMLRPGQQAIVQITARTGADPLRQADGTSIRVMDNINMEQIMAWKNGLFSFKDADLPTLMRQLERWYDIQVKYEGAIPKFRFQGELDRGVNLSDVLEILTKMEVKYKRTGKTLIIME